MKATISFFTNFLILNLLFSGHISAQRLIVGSGDPDEIFIIDSATVQYDTVLVINQGQLLISNSGFTVNQALIVKDEGYLNVQNSSFVVNGPCIFIENSTSALRDDLTFHGDIYTLGKALLIIDSANVIIPMTFVGQFRFVGLDSAEFRISHSNCNLGSGKLGGNFSGQSNFIQQYTAYQNQAGIAMTIGIGGQASIVVDNCTGGMEFVIGDSANVDIGNSAGFVLWHRMDENSIVDITFPPANSLIQNASNVSNYTFSDSVPGVSGIGYSINVQATNVVFWAVLPRAGSNVTINNSTIIGCGFTFSGTVKDTISGLVNDSSYTTFTAPFTDRSFTLNNTTIKAWNFYALEESEIVIRNSVFGEALTFHQSKLTVENSVCDGTGGYVGAKHNSTMQVIGSTIKRIGNGPAIIVNTDNSSVIVEESLVSGAVMINHTSRLMYSNVTKDHEPVVNGASFFLDVFLDSLGRVDQDSIIPITGTLRSVQGLQNQDMISSYQMKFSHIDSSDMTLIADLPYTGDIINGVLSDWNSAGIPAGGYRIWLTSFVNGDSALTTGRNIFIDETATIEDQNDIPGKFALFQNYPNPFNPKTTISYTLANISNVEIIIYNTAGRKIKTLIRANNVPAKHYNIEWDGKNTLGEQVASGVYLYQIITDNYVSSKKMLLLR